MNRLRLEFGGRPRPATDEVLDEIAEAVREAGRCLSPWPDPLTIVVAAGFIPVVCGPEHSLELGLRRVGFVWCHDRQVRGVRILRAFAAALLRYVMGDDQPDADAVERLAVRLLIPAPMLLTARRDPNAAERHATREFVAARLLEHAPARSGLYVAVRTG